MSNLRLRPYTVGVRGADGTGTTHVQTYYARSRDHAMRLARIQVRKDWGYDNDEPLHILCVLKGDVDVLYWDDPYD